MPLENWGLSKLKHSQIHDRHEENEYTNVWRPPTWTANREVFKDEDSLIGTVSAGLRHDCVSGGLTGATEPDWTTEEGGFTIDGTAKFKAVPQYSMLRAGDIIAASTWYFSDNDLWTAGKTVEKNESLIPNVPNGFEYDCPLGGTTGGVEPIYPVIEGDTVTDGTCVLHARFVGTYSDDIISDGIITSVKITAIPEELTEINLLNKVSITRSTAKTEKKDRTMLIKVSEL